MEIQIKSMHKFISIPNGEILVTRYWQDESVGPFYLFAIDDRNLKTYNIANGNMILKDTKSGHWTLRSPDSEGNQVLFKRIGSCQKMIKRLFAFCFFYSDCIALYNIHYQESSSSEKSDGPNSYSLSLSSSDVGTQIPVQSSLSS